MEEQWSLMFLWSLLCDVFAGPAMLGVHHQVSHCVSIWNLLQVHLQSSLRKWSRVIVIVMVIVIVK